MPRSERVGHARGRPASTHGARRCGGRRRRSVMRVLARASLAWSRVRRRCCAAAVWRRARSAAAAVVDGSVPRGAAPEIRLCCYCCRRAARPVSPCPRPPPLPVFLPVFFFARPLWRCSTLRSADQRARARVDSWPLPPFPSLSIPFNPLPRPGLSFGVFLNCRCRYLV